MIQQLSINRRKVKLTSFIFTEGFFVDAGDLKMSGEITYMLTFWFEAESFFKQTVRLINSTPAFHSLLAELQQHHGL